MKRKLIKYYLLFALLVPELKAFAQLDHHYHSGRKAKEQSELFPNKLIRLRNKYVFNQKLLREKNTCSLLTDKNDKAINLQLEDVKRNRKIRNGAYLIGIPTAIAGGAYLVTGFFYGFLESHRSKESLASQKKLINIGEGLSIVSGTSLIIGAGYSVKNRRAINRAVKIYNQKY